MTSKRATASRGLVGLQRADQAQLDALGARGRAQRAMRLLHPVLAEHALAGGQHRRRSAPGGCCLETATRVTSAGSRPAASAARGDAGQRRRRGPRRMSGRSRPLAQAGEIAALHRVARRLKASAERRLGSRARALPAADPDHRPGAHARSRRRRPRRLPPRRGGGLPRLRRGRTPRDVGRRLAAVARRRGLILLVGADAGLARADRRRRRPPARAPGAPGAARCGRPGPAGPDHRRGP